MPQTYIVGDFETGSGYSRHALGRCIRRFKTLLIGHKSP